MRHVDQVQIVAAGGLLIAFGTRYTDGRTSGHTVMGIAKRNWPSMVASVFFIVGGLSFVWIVRPLFG